MINETRLDSEIADSEISISGYNIVHKDRNRFVGGVLLYIKDAWNFLTKEFNSDLEILTVEITGKFIRPFLVSMWYRPPASEMKVFYSLETYFSTLDDENKETIILVDFNCNALATG